MIFGDFFKKNFSFDISQWCDRLPVSHSAAVLVLYCALNLFGPWCFEAVELRMTVAPLAAFLLVGIFLYLQPGRIADLCAFRKLPSGSAYKVVVAVFAAFLLTFISHYWSCEFFKYINWAVKEEQPLAKTLKDASVAGCVVIGFTAIVLAPVGEEVVFRRMLYGILSELGAVKAVLLTSFLFSILHFHLVGTVGLFFFALILQLLYLNTKNIWHPIQLHMIFNALSFISVLSDK